MPTTISLTYPIVAPRRFEGLTLNLSEIFRRSVQLAHTQTFQQVAETATLLTLFTGLTIWIFALTSW